MKRLILAALMAGIFSIFTGFAGSAALFIAARAGFGLGIRLNDPVQQSLLSDYYAVETRATTFAGRQGMDNLGQLIGPLFFGIVTAVTILLAAPYLWLRYFVLAS